MNRFLASLRLFAAALILFGATHATAQLDIAKPIRWLVPYQPGGAADFFARGTSQYLHESKKQSVVVDYKPGATGAIAVSELLRAPADGRTLVGVDNGIMVFNAALYSSLRYSPSDLIPVALFGRAHMILIVPTSSGITDARGLFARIKAQPGKFNYASAGAGSPHHLAMEMLKRSADLNITHVPYRGGAPAVTEVAGAHVLTMMADYAAARPFIESGKVRPIAVAHSSRVSYLPEVPALPELGISGADASGWLGVAVRAGTPTDQIRGLNASITSAINEPGFKKRIEDMGFEVENLSPEQFQSQITSEIARWHKLIKEQNISLD